jgi:hypothetical protein
MSATRHMLHLTVEGLSPARREELEKLAARAGGAAEIMALTEANSREALEKIFAADAVAVWGALVGETK